jgi:acyl-coenzyme A synthetase/AMP-(fatty) acid ligase
MVPARYVAEAELTIWFSVPSTAVVLNRLRKLRPGAFPGLRLALFCGEALPAELAAAFAEAAPGAVVENLYGPTELTIACTLYRFDPERSPAECEQGLVPIGAPYPGMEVLVVDPSLREVAPGETGELLMSGPQRTLGYWQDPERTAAAFVVPPGHRETFYRTGDRVRRPHGDGPLVYLGRTDHQVKIQGYRVELGEIESVLREVAGVDVAVALGWPETASGADGVVAFVAAGGGDAEAVRREAGARLPAYMAPREVRVVERFPLNANGKVDRKALRASLEGPQQALRAPLEDA